MPPKAEIRATQLQARESPRLPANDQKLGRGKEGCPYRFQRAHGPADTLFWSSSLQNRVTINICCFKRLDFDTLLLQP